MVSESSPLIVDIVYKEWLKIWVSMVRFMNRPLIFLIAWDLRTLTMNQTFHLCHWQKILFCERMAEKAVQLWRLATSGFSLQEMMI
jgi:hypothetical protein